MPPHEGPGVPDSADRGLSGDPPLAYSGAAAPRRDIGAAVSRTCMAG